MQPAQEADKVSLGREDSGVVDVQPAGDVLEESREMPPHDPESDLGEIEFSGFDLEVIFDKKIRQVWNLTIVIATKGLDDFKRCGIV